MAQKIDNAESDDPKNIATQEAPREIVALLGQPLLPEQRHLLREYTTGAAVVERIVVIGKDMSPEGRVSRRLRVRADELLLTDQAIRQRIVKYAETTTRRVDIDATMERFKFWYESGLNIHAAAKILTGRPESMEKTIRIIIDQKKEKRGGFIFEFVEKPSTTSAVGLRILMSEDIQHLKDVGIDTETMDFIITSLHLDARDEYIISEFIRDSKSPSIPDLWHVNEIIKAIYTCLYSIETNPALHSH